MSVLGVVSVSFVEKYCLEYLTSGASSLNGYERKQERHQQSETRLANGQAILEFHNQARQNKRDQKPW